MPACSGLVLGLGAESLLQGGGEGAGGADGVGELGPVQPQDGGDRGRGAERADGPRGVPIPVVRGLHGDADPRRDLVADDDGAQQRVAVHLPALGGGQHGGDHRAAGMIDRITENIIELDGVGGYAVEQGGGAQWRALVDAVNGGAAMAELVGQSAEQPRRGFEPCTGQKCGEPVDQGALGVVADLVRQPAGLLVHGVFGDGFDQRTHGRGLR